MLRIDLSNKTTDLQHHDTPPHASAQEEKKEKNLGDALGDLSLNANTSIFALALAVTARAHLGSDNVMAFRLIAVAGVFVVAFALFRFVRTMLRTNYNIAGDFFIFGPIFAALIFVALIGGEIWLLVALW